MKRPEYTAIVTGIYHRAVHEGVAPTEKDMELLRLAFSRDGFTDGYYTGEKKEMLGVRGEADKDAAKLFAQVRRSYASGELRRLDVDFNVSLSPRRAAALTAQDRQGHSATVYGPVPEPAQTADLSLSGLSTQLYKTGGTPFRCRSVEGTVEPGLYLPAAAINALRRDALEALSAQLTEPPRRRTGLLPPPPHGRDSGGTLLNVQVLSAAQLTPELAETGPGNVYIPLPLLASLPQETLEPFRASGSGLVAVLPRVITDTELPQVVSLLEQAKAAGIQEALVGNLGHIALARSAGFDVRGDFGLNLFNSYTAQVLADAELRSVTASFELRMAQVRDLIKCVDTELIIYGRLPCMVSDQCIISQSTGGCNCDSGSVSLSDRMGSVFPVVREFGCRNVILNSHKLFLADKTEDILGCGLWAGRLMFTTETPRECVQIVRAYQGQSDYRPNGLTRGLYYRGVE